MEKQNILLKKKERENVRLRRALTDPTHLSKKINHAGFSKKKCSNYENNCSVSSHEDKYLVDDYESCDKEDYVFSCEISPIH